MEHSSPLTAFTPDMFMRNFAEAEPPLTHKGALDESNRCLYCYDAPV